MSKIGNIKSIVMDADGIERSLTRIAHQILEKNKGAGNIAIVGVVTRGDLLAKRLADKISEIEGVDVPLGRLDISFYRDDFATYMSPDRHPVRHRRARYRAGRRRAVHRSHNPRCA